MISTKHKAVSVTSIAILLWLFSVSAAPRVVSGEVESVHTKIDATDKNGPDTVTFSLVEAGNYVMFTRKVVTFSKGDTINVYISSAPVQIFGKVACIVEVTAIKVTNAGKLSELSLPKPLWFIGEEGPGCDQ